MNVTLDSTERYVVQQIAQEVAEQIREHVFSHPQHEPVLWSKAETAYRIGGEHEHVSIDFVDDLIADGQIEAVKSGANGGGRTLIVPESVEAWKQRKRNEKRRKQR